MRVDFILCQPMILIGSGMIWNICFGVIAVLVGFCTPIPFALAKGAR